MTAPRWKLVPVEPTERQLDAGYETFGDNPMLDHYRAMLAAAPEPDAGLARMINAMVDEWYRWSPQRREDGTWVALRDGERRGESVREDFFAEVRALECARAALSVDESQDKETAE